MDNITKLNLLFDYYGDFLTKKQRDIFEQYYINDLSLGEIAENSGITRQGVHDILRRAERTLENFEKKLDMVNKYLSYRKKIEKILVLLEEIEPGVAAEYKQKFTDIYNGVATLLKEGGV
ncbi:MAG: YlxM family DNA-binding protein [Tepidanaerobacteraceae bacterium]|nr:YlxM family DNA-binding protein [Tepidanaerobacter sp.]HQA59910.1 YlxM family DNA-binding protein [Tepidanaerobacteraceae bacterium]HQE05715.1 YlxM family DNA-binding protein [Tepidanaerobacteraceae bacterium]